MPLDPDLLKDNKLFGRIWSYEALEARRESLRQVPDDWVEPDNWPPECTVKRDGKRAFWLPEGWVAATSTSVSDVERPCFVSPDGVRKFHKKEVEKLVGYKLPTVDPQVADDSNDVKDPRNVPEWPSEDWLPTDWYVVFRRAGKNGKSKNKCYIPPGGEGFFWFRATAEAWLNDGAGQPRPFDEADDPAAEPGTTPVKVEATEVEPPKKRTRRSSGKEDDGERNTEDHPDGPSREGKKAKATPSLQQEPPMPTAHRTGVGSVIPVAHPKADMLKHHPLFGRIFTRSEAIQKTMPRVPEDFVEPDCWPERTRADRTATALLSAWLPEGWFPAIGTTVNGKEVKCFVSITGKRYWHKPDLAKHLGVTFPPTRSGKQEEETNVKDPNLLPPWPKEDWLPHDWLLVYRRLGGVADDASTNRLHKCFVDPEATGFFYHRENVETYLANGYPPPTPFEESRLQSQVKTKIKHNEKIVTSSDYEEAKWLAVTRLPSLTSDAQQAFKGYGKLNAVDRLVRDGKDVSAWLLKRGFEEQTDMVAIFCQNKKAPDHKLFDWISGWYYRKTTFGERPCYMGIGVNTATKNMFCKGTYLFWSEPHGCWKAAAAINDNRAGLVKCSEDVKLPSDAKKAWQIVSMSAVQSWQNSAAR
eukprot:TRINITY_DN5671_c1_g1_i2.p1 TRINITY_DN5671_c1_g1~~TRINITY_DN5671_c1_g1_i2.p1  ORF type:complete len:642 (-),score=80.82 TRINITY_DN5671_c1_g1_i2:110-2035(-)